MSKRCEFKTKLCHSTAVRSWTKAHGKEHSAKLDPRRRHSAPCWLDALTLFMWAGCIANRSLPSAHLGTYLGKHLDPHLSTRHGFSSTPCSGFEAPCLSLEDRENPDRKVSAPLTRTVPPGEERHLGLCNRLAGMVHRRRKGVEFLSEFSSG